MENISSVNFNTPSNLQSNLGFNSGFNASSLATDNRFSFGGLNIETLASGLIEAAKSGNLSDGLVEMLAKILSPVEMGQLLSAVEKLISSEGNSSGSTEATDAMEGNSESSCNSSSDSAETQAANNKSGTPSASTSAPATSAPSTAAPSTATPVANSPATSNSRITTRASDSANIPAVEAIANDPVVAAAIEKAWNASNPNTPGAKQEQGFWVMRDDKTGALSTVNFPSNGTRDSLTPGAVPAIEGKTAVSFFHTHPNTAAEGFTTGPSTADQNFADARGIPGIIQSHAGVYYFGAI
jgi:hypothetical protein